MWIHYGPFDDLFFLRGRHASKVTEEEEDEEYLKDEDELSGNTRLVAQPSCKIYLDASVFVI